MTATVWLVGFPLAGKTTIGALVARERAMEFIDLDRDIERAAGRSIAEIWEAGGEGEFRRIEAGRLAAVAGRRAVVATGGGAPLAAENRERMRRSGLVLWLVVPFEIIWKRATSRCLSDRPLLGNGADLARLWRERETAYNFADVHVDCGARPASEIALEIAAILAEREGRNE